MGIQLPGLFVPEAGDQYGKGRLVGDTAWFGSSRNAIPFITSGFRAYEPWRQEMGLGPHPGSDVWFEDVDRALIKGPQRSQVIAKGYDPAGGHFIGLDLGVRDGVRELISVYHLAEAPAVNPGDLIGQFQPFARSDNSGSATTGSHQHWVRFTGEPGGPMAQADFMGLFSANYAQPGILAIDDHPEAPEPIQLLEMYKLITDAFIPAYIPEDAVSLDEVSPDDGYIRQFVIRVRD